MSTKSSVTSPTRLSRYTGKLYDRATGEYLGRIERHVDNYGDPGERVTWFAIKPEGDRHSADLLREAKSWLYDGKRAKETT